MRFLLLCSRPAGKLHVWKASGCGHFLEPSTTGAVLNQNLCVSSPDRAPYTPWPRASQRPIRRRRARAKSALTPPSSALAFVAYALGPGVDRRGGRLYGRAIALGWSG